jgi:hypothetical protein
MLQHPAGHRRCTSGKAAEGGFCRIVTTHLGGEHERIAPSVKAGAVFDDPLNKPGLLE